MTQAAADSQGQSLFSFFLFLSVSDFGVFGSIKFSLESVYFFQFSFYKPENVKHSP